MDTVAAIDEVHAVLDGRLRSAEELAGRCQLQIPTVTGCLRALRRLDRAEFVEMAPGTFSWRRGPQTGVQAMPEDHAADKRDREADKRDRAADKRDRTADAQDRKADAQDRKADEHDRMIEEQDRQDAASDLR